MGTRLEELIKSLGIKKGDFAEKINFSQAYISMIISNPQKQPSERFFDSIKREFNVNIDWLKNGVGEMFEYNETGLADTDKELIVKYNKLPLSERKLIDDMVNAMIMKNNYLEQTKESD